MINQFQSYVRLRQILRLIRVEDYGTFIQLIIGFILTDGQDGWYLASALIVLAPCIYGGLYALNDVHDMDADRLHPVPCKNLIQSDLLRKTGTPVLVTVIGRIGSSRTMEHIIKWVGSFSSTFSRPFLLLSLSDDCPAKKKIWKS
jgi:4-hydroxybenzoate polyprenyltransferase